MPLGASVRFSLETVVISVATPEKVSEPVVVIAPASIVVAPLIAPVFVMPLLLLFMPPVIDAPFAETVKPLAEVILPVPVVTMLPVVERTPSSLMVNEVTPFD